MVKRVVVIAAVGIATVFALPTIALGDENESTETSSTESTQSTEVQQQVTEVTLEEPVEDESTEAETSDEVEPQTAPTTRSSSTTTASTAATSTATTSTASTQTSLTTAEKASGKKKKARSARKSGKRCSASSRGGGQLATASAPLAPGCFARFNPDELDGDGVTFNVPGGGVVRIQLGDEQGEVVVTVIDGPVGAQLFVKGGPDSPGASCDLSNLTEGVPHSCFTPTNTKGSGKPYGVSHVDICPTTTQPGTTEEEEGRKEGRDENKKVAGGKKKKQPEFVAAGETVTPQGETLPFTGLPVAWLLIVGAGLISGGLAIRRKP